MEDAAGELARAMGLPVPREQSQREALILAARRTLNAPDLRGINLKAPEWDSHPEEPDELLAAGVALSAVRSEFSTVLEPEAWTQQVSNLKETLTEASGRRTRLLSGDYRRARSTLSQICVSKPPSELADQLSLLDAIQHSQEQVRIIDRHLSLGVVISSGERT